MIHYNELYYHCTGSYNSTVYCSHHTSGRTCIQYNVLSEGSFEIVMVTDVEPSISSLSFTGTILTVKGVTHVCAV